MYKFCTFPSRPHVYSQRWGQMGASSSVCFSMNWKTRSLCMPSIASSRYLSLAAWKQIFCVTIWTFEQHNCFSVMVWSGLLNWPLHETQGKWGKWYLTCDQSHTMDLKKKLQHLCQLFALCFRTAQKLFQCTYICVTLFTRDAPIHFFNFRYQYLMFSIDR